jgi:hypothetical protein
MSGLAESLYPTDKALNGRILAGLLQNLLVCN